jgi:hypothetical protein
LAKESKLTTIRKGTTKEDIIKLLAWRKKLGKIIGNSPLPAI